jgi:predicted O-methyltransferase YrrM
MLNFNCNSLDNFFHTNKINVTEGNCNNISQQCSLLINICKDIKPTKIMEIGFNAGHSAELFLKNSQAYVHSFDIGLHFHSYLKFGKIYLNNKFLNRHTLVLGDSTERIPIFSKNNPDLKFDIIFIDGGHDYNIAISDLINCRNLAHPNTIVIMDDIVKDNRQSAPYTIGPTRAWNECISKNIIQEDNYYFFTHGRGMSIGKYIF